MVWARLYKNPFAVLGLVILLITILAAIFAPLIAVESPIKMNIREAMLPTGSPNHPLGTDDLGRDVLSRLIYGSRVSLQVGLIVVGISATVGVTLGAISGYYGGVIDNIIMRFFGHHAGFSISGAGAGGGVYCGRIADQYDDCTGGGQLG